MINIAVCDDDVQFAAALEEKILDYGKQKGVRLDTEVFSDGESFRQAVFNDSFYDLVYMDVEMGKSDGIYTVWEVKKKLSEVLVIYVTSHETYFRKCLKQSLFDTLKSRWTKKSSKNILPGHWSVYRDIYTILLIQADMRHFVFLSGIFCTLKATEGRSSFMERREAILSMEGLVQ